MKYIHVVINEKGGVGKSFIASLLIQYLKSNELGVMAIDTDQGNQTLFNTKGLDAKFLNLIDKRTDKIDEREFDRLIVSIDELEDSFEHIVIDVGSNVYRALREYFLENKILEFLLQEKKYRVFFHVPIVADASEKASIDALSTLINDFPEAEFVVWINQHFGMSDFLKNPIRKTLDKKISGFVILKFFNPKTFGQDLAQLNRSKLIFDDVSEDDEFNLMAKHRLGIIRETFYSAIDVVMQGIEIK